jgi:hypothetical protein
MSVLHSQNFDLGDLGPIESALRFLRDRVVARSEQKAIRMVQIYGKLTGSVACQFMATGLREGSDF